MIVDEGFERADERVRLSIPRTLSRRLGEVRKYEGRINPYTLETWNVNMSGLNLGHYYCGSSWFTALLVLGLAIQLLKRHFGVQVSGTQQGIDSTPALFIRVPVLEFVPVAVPYHRSRLEHERVHICSLFGSFYSLRGSHFRRFAFCLGLFGAV